MIKTICQYCGKEFNANRKNMKYCSRECYYKGREYLSGENNPQYKRERRICKNCGKEFKTRPSEKKIFCSNKCSYIWNKDKININSFKKGHKSWSEGKVKEDYPQLSNSGVKEGNIPWNKGTKGLMPESWNKGDKSGKTLTCEICGKKYYAPPSILEVSKYCSWGCFSESKRRVTGKTHPLYTRIETKCDWCGKLYKEIPAKMEMYKHHFCSRRCAGCYTTSHQNRTSSIEKKLANYLIENKISFICQFKYKLGVADFFIKPNLIIEVDGDYWHNLPNVKERDKRQTLYLEEEGYAVLHLWEHEINKEPEKCINRVKELINI